MQNPFTYQVKGKKIKIVVISDPHWGCINCDEGAVESAIKDNSDALFLFLGDTLDCITVRDFKRFRLSSIHPRFLANPRSRDDLVRSQAKDFIEMVQRHGIQKRIIGMVSGNHPDKYLSDTGTDIHNWICEELKCANLGYDFTLRLNWTVTSTTRRDVWIYGHHGYGAGRSEGGDITRFSKQIAAHPYADILLFGHTHRKTISYQTSFRPILKDGRYELEPRNHLLCVCGTFLKTLSDGVDPSYSERAGYAPIPIDYVTLNLKEIQNHKVDIKAS